MDRKLENVKNSIENGIDPGFIGDRIERLMAELRAGHIYQSAEEGTEADTGQMRLTFRFRARVARLIVGHDGSVRPEDSRTH